MTFLSIRSFFMTAVLLGGGTLFSVAMAAKSDLKDLNEFVANLQTFSASFEQTQPDEGMFQQNRSKGYFVMARPGKLRWVYQSPEPQQIIADGVNVWIFDEDLDQATVRSLASVESDFPMSWLIYDEPLNKRFTLIAGEVKNGVSWYNLVPKKGTFFQSLEVAIANGQMVQIWMYQNADNVTKVAFKDIAQNESIENRNFRFSAPNGVDVIGQPLPLAQ